MSDNAQPRPFIDDDEHIILMDYPVGALSVDDLKRLRDVGIKTAYGYLFWYNLEPRRGQYEWRVPDYIVERLQKADMKLLLLTSEAPTWAPNDWYAQQPDGRIWRAFYDGYRDGWAYSVFSPWSRDAQEYQRQFERMVRDRYADLGTVQCIAGAPHGGEVLLPGMVECWFDAAAIADFRRYAREGFGGDLGYFNKANHTQFQAWDAVMPALLPDRSAMETRPTMVDWLHDTLIENVMAAQSIMADTPWRETWYMLPQREGEFAESFESGPRSCNWLAGELYRLSRDRLQATTNILLFEVFRTRGTQGILEPIAGHEAHTWVGSQFVQGLQRHTLPAIAHGLRGFLTGPVHPDSGCRTLDPWMLDAFRWSLDQWKAADL